MLQCAPIRDIGTGEPNKPAPWLSNMRNEKAKETMLMVAADCDRFAARAAMRSLDELAVRRVIKGS